MTADRSRSSPDYQVRWAEPTAGRQPPADDPLLEEVIRQTVAALEAAGGLQAADAAAWDKLRLIVSRHGGPAVMPVDAAADMVGAVLEDGFRPLLPSEAEWRQMCLAISRTLCDNPASRRRLEALWQRLAERS